jgi:hypothetical protein
VRKLAALALEVVASGGSAAANGVAGGAAPASEGDSLDLSGGSREFLTRDSAEELLAPMLAPGAKISKVLQGGRVVLHL